MLFLLILISSDEFILSVSSDTVRMASGLPAHPRKADSAYFGDMELLEVKSSETDCRSVLEKTQFSPFFGDLIKCPVPGITAPGWRW